jgi:ankyrin repeat protein
MEDKASAASLIQKCSPEQVSHANKYGNTPLHRAIEKGDQVSAASLIQKCTPEQLLHVNTDGNTPLHWAIEKGDKDSICNILGKLASYNLEAISDLLSRHQDIIKEALAITGVAEHFDALISSNN